MELTLKTIVFLILLLNAGGLTACVGASEPLPVTPVPAGTPLSVFPSPVVPAVNDAAGTTFAGQWIFAAERNGRWDLYTASSQGGVWQPLTNDGASRAPAISRDGAQIAFQSHRDGNWEIYIAQTDGSHVTRLTHDLAFDGNPTWSPDGKQIAFTSARQKNLRVWVMDVNGANPHNLTADSAAANFAPTWSPDGKWIAFTSQRTGAAQIFIVSPDGKQALNLSQNTFDDQTPAWSPDGTQIAFVSDRDGQRAIYVADFSPTGLRNARRLTFSGWEDAPAWSPDGKYIAFVSPRPTRQPMYIVPITGGVPRALDDQPIQVETVAWANVVAPLVDHPAAHSLLLYEQSSPRTPAALMPLKDVYLAPSYGEMSNRVAGSFEALRAKVKAEAGWDFLGVLSDMTRQPASGVCGNGCEFMSWHMTGRAVDTRLGVATGGVSMMELVREDQLGETYWRVYLRAAKQDGTQGEPLKEAPWDWTYYARWTLSPHQGGVPKPIPSGYYIDFTELAREYGWDRISSYDDPTLSWKENNIGMEFWHFQKAEGLTWYAAMSELYSSQTRASTFDWNTLLRQKTDPYLLTLKGLPAPPSAWRWFVLFP